MGAAELCSQKVGAGVLDGFDDHDHNGSSNSNNNNNVALGNVDD